MPAPLQPSPQNRQLPPGQAHVEILARRHSPHPPSAPSIAPTAQSTSTQQLQQHQQQQHARAQNIPMSQGPKVLKKRHTVSAPVLEPDAPSSNTTAAIFAARVRFAEPAREETKEARKQREKTAAREKEEAKKREKEEAKRAAKREKEMQKAGGNVERPSQGIFAPDYPEMREQARAARASGRKLSKRR